MVDEGLITMNNGFLTEKQRRYLTGQIDMSENYENPQKRSNTFRHRIRNRVKGAIKDFIIIEKYLTGEDWDKIFEEYKSFTRDIKSDANNKSEAANPSDRALPDILQGSRAAIQFLISALAEMEGRQNAMYTIEDCLKEVVQRASAQGEERFYYGNICLDVDDIEANSIDLAEARRELEKSVKEVDGNSDGTNPVALMIEVIDCFAERLPAMPAEDFPRLIQKLYVTGSINRKEYEQLYDFAAVMVKESKQSNITEAIKNWDWSEYDI